MNTRFVITGIGMISPLGFNAEKNWENLLAGNKKADTLDLDLWEINTEFPNTACIIDKEKIVEYIPTNKLKKMDYYSAYALISTEEALNDCGIDYNDEEIKKRLGVSIGTSFGGFPYAEKVYKKYISDINNNKYPKVTPYLSIASFHCSASGHVSIENGFKSKIYSVPNGNTSGIDNIFCAMQAIKTETVDIMFAGSSEAPYAPYCYNAIYSLGKLFEDVGPEDWCSNSFNEQKNGFTLSEGCGIVAVEELEHAKKRDAKIYGEILSCYNSISDDLVKSGVNCLNKVVKHANIDKSEIDLIISYADGTETDTQELEFLEQFFGDDLSDIPVTAFKPLTGNALSSSSIFEIIAGLQCMNNNQIIPIKTNSDELLHENKINYVKNTIVEKEINNFLMYSIDFTGKISAIIIKKYKD